MMWKKLIYLLFVVSVLALTPTTFAIEIGNFENDMDGWSTVEPNIVTSFSTVGATSGQNSLRIDATTTGDQDAIVLDLIAQNLVDEFRNNLKISADITRLASEWTDAGGSWCDFSLAVRAGSSVAGSEWEYRDTAPENADWWVERGDDPMSVTYDYSLTLNQIDFDNLEYLELIFTTNWGGFTPGGIYYLDNVQMFGGGPAYDPEPADGARDVSRATVLSWTSGVNAITHDVYFGTNLDAVSNASRDNPMGVLVRQDQGINTYNPGTLVAGENYFWRIDEVNDTDIVKGEVWSFTTAYASKGYILGDFEDSMDNWVVYPSADSVFSYSTTGATLNEKSLKVEATSYWIIRLNLNADQLEALKANDLLVMDVTWDSAEWEGHDWAQVHKIAINSAATGWSEMDYPISDTSNPDDPGSWNPSFEGIDTRTLVWDYSEIDVAGIEEGGWTQINISQNHDSGAGVGTYYFDNVRLLNTRTASEPNPANGAIDVKIDPTLSWFAGNYAVSHDVYIGTDFNDINEVNMANLTDYPNVTSANISTTDYAPGILEFNSTYYWRVDEVNEAHPDVRWKGDIWSFTTGNFLVVDDFEDYNDWEPDTVYLAWVDGYDNPTNGSTVGYPEPIFSAGEHFVETNIVHSGFQAMPYFYDNTAAPISEATRTLSSMSNWTRNNVDTLSLWYIAGQQDNAPEPMFITLNGTATVTNDNPNATQVTEWTEWRIDLQTFANTGINLANVNMVTIGFGDTPPGGSGMVIFDDIRLYLP